MLILKYKMFNYLTNFIIVINYKLKFIMHPKFK